jgi:hypothetical protein
MLEALISKGDVAADRIEELEAKLARAVGELGAKLARAVGELEEMLMIQNSEAAYGILRVYTKALLAELKGEKG